MAVTRSAVIKAKDAGRWLKVDNTVLGVRGDTVDVADNATRYVNLNTLDSQIPSTYWYPNQWNDESKTLFDAAYGYEIKDKFFSDPAGSATFGVSPTPNVAGGAKSANTLDRTSILFSYDAGAWVYITNPLAAPASWNAEFVNDSNQATRFDDLLDVATWLNATVYGNVNNGYGIQQYAFTKAPQTPFNFSFNWIPTASKTIFRAYVPYSNQEGAYLRVADTGVPIANMQFSYVTNAWEGTRFQNTNDIKAIIDGRPDFFGTTTKAGWELPQFFFTQATKTPKSNSFDDFFTTDPCGVTNLGIKFGDTFTWFGIIAANQFCGDWRGFYSHIVDVIFQDPQYWADHKCFWAWWEQQDHEAFTDWLFNKVWLPNSC